MTTPVPPAVLPRSWDGQHRRRQKPPARSRPHILQAIKLLLLVGGFGSLATVVLWDRGRPPEVTEEPGVSVSTPSHVMSGARLVGTDIENRRYTVTAKQVYEETDETHAVHLDDLHARLFSGETEVSLTAAAGHYDAPTRRMAMSGGVRMDTRTGTVLETESAAYFPSRGLVEGTVPVRVEGPWGVIQAGGFRYETASGILKFTGRPQLRLRPGDRS